MLQYFYVKVRNCKEKCKNGVGWGPESGRNEGCDLEISTALTVMFLKPICVLLH